MQNIYIGPYVISRRTEYSKIQVFDNTGANIVDTKNGIKILEDYHLQEDNSNKYFNINGNTLISFDNDYGADIEYLFLPEGIESIERMSFHGGSFSYFCTPNSLTNIGTEAFRDCFALKEMYLPLFIDNIGHGIFGRCIQLENVALPENIKTIPRFMFDECYSLESIKLPSCVIKLDDGAFYRCNKLTDIVLPDTVEEIGESTFYECFSLRKINIPKSFKSFKVDAFKHCGLNELIFNHDLEKRSPSCYSNFSRCVRISKITINNTVGFIDSNLFANDMGKDIEEVEYRGSKEQFKEFKKKNKELFKQFSRVKINIVNNTLDNELENNKESHITENKKEISER